MVKIDLRLGRERTSTTISKEHHGLLLRIAALRGESTPARLLDPVLHRAPKGQRRQVAEAWIRANAPADPMAPDEKDRLIARLEEHNRLLEETVRTRTRELVQRFRQALLLAAGGGPVPEL